jgi:uncharacterized protein YjbJ (UPF0337 family)
VCVGCENVDEGDATEDDRAEQNASGRIAVHRVFPEPPFVKARRRLFVPGDNSLRGRELFGGSSIVLATKELHMDKDRVEGVVEQAKGKVKEVAGKVTGDTKTEAEGKADQVKGKIQNTIGGIKDTLRGK